MFRKRVIEVDEMLILEDDAVREAAVKRTLGNVLAQDVLKLNPRQAILFVVGDISDHDI